MKAVDPRAEALKKRLQSWAKKEYRHFAWKDHVSADLAFESAFTTALQEFSATDRNKREHDEFAAILVEAGACFETGPYMSTITTIYFLPENPIGNAWCIKKDDGEYIDFMPKRTLEVSRHAGIVETSGKIVQVRLEPVKGKETSSWWAYWDTVEKGYSLVFPSKSMVQVCSDDFFKSAEKQKKGKVINVTIKEV